MVDRGTALASRDEIDRDQLIGEIRTLRSQGTQAFATRGKRDLPARATLAKDAEDLAAGLNIPELHGPHVRHRETERRPQAVWKFAWQHRRRAESLAVRREPE